MKLEWNLYGDDFYLGHYKREGFSSLGCHLPRSFPPFARRTWRPVPRANSQLTRDVTMRGILAMGPVATWSDRPICLVFNSFLCVLFAFIPSRSMCTYTNLFALVYNRLTWLLTKEGAGVVGGFRFHCISCVRLRVDNIFFLNNNIKLIISSLA